MQIILTRGSVCQGDDVAAPHKTVIKAKVCRNIGDIISGGYLPNISGGKATWSAVSGDTLAIIAQEWKKPKILSLLSVDQLDYDSKGRLKIHFNYHAQADPNMVFEVLREPLKIGIWRETGDYG